MSVSRRELIRIAGASAAAAAAFGSTGCRKQAEVPAFDREVDVVVVGSGAAGASAALFARAGGAEVLLLEKAALVGGTTAKSGGVYWIPNHPIERAKGLKETREATLRDMARASYPLEYRESDPELGLGEHAYGLLAALYDAGTAAVEGLEKMGALISMAADGMVGALPDYFEKATDERAVVDRRYWARQPNGQFGLGGEMVRQLREGLEKAGVPILLQHRALRLVANASGAVVGVEAENLAAGGAVVRIRARRGVVFGSGGFTHSPELMRAHQPGPVFGGCAVPTNQGDFVHMAESVGARFGLMGSAWRAQIVLEQALLDPSTPDDVFMPPGDSMILVNRFGRRVVNEKSNYNERTRVHFAWDPSRHEWTNLVLCMVYDQRTAELFGGRYPLPPAGLFAPYVITGRTLQELALGIDARLEKLADRLGGVRLDPGFAENLTASIARFGELAKSGVDADFERGLRLYDRSWHARIWSYANQGTPHAPAAPNVTMHPFAAEGPYHAILLAAGTLDTNGGPVVDANGQVLGHAGAPIPGLYGAGNCVASPTGTAYYAGGGTLGPALAFGYLAGSAAARAPVNEVIPT